MKKAVLVKFEIITRMIVEADENGKVSEREEEFAVESAIDKIKGDIDNYLFADNLAEIKEDTEVLFGKGNSGSWVVEVNDIEWDATDDEIEDNALPPDVDLHLTEEQLAELEKNNSLAADWVSEQYGYTVKSFTVLLP